MMMVILVMITIIIHHKVWRLSESFRNIAAQSTSVCGAFLECNAVYSEWPPP